MSAIKAFVQGAVGRLLFRNATILRADALGAGAGRFAAHVDDGRSGAVHGQGVLDIIDPSSLTLLARHNLEIVSARGNPLAGNALATDGDVLAFAPDRQPPPTIMAYRLREGRLIDLVPALLP